MTGVILLGRLAELVPETQTECFAWALIANHAHLLFRTGSVPVSRLMSRLLTGYAGWFNKKYHRHGQLFQNRYKSILCQEDAYLKELVRYIHLNPLRGGPLGDERILGDSDFVEKVLKFAQELLEEKYGLKKRGYDFDKAVERVSELMDMDVSQVLAFDKAPKTVQARALLCFFAHRKLGMTTIEIAGRLKISQSVVSRLSRKGEIIEREKSIKLIG